MNPISTHWGDGTYFGQEDYIGNRKAGHSDLSILEYLDANPNTLRNHNVKGNTDGIYEHIAGRGKINTRVGNRADMFGHKDYDEMKRMGWTNDAILKHLDQNPNQLANRNKARSSITPINTSVGNRADMFGHKDYDAAREAGWHNQEILAYMDENPHLLADRNKKGASWADAGELKPLYDWVRKQGIDQNAPLYDLIANDPNRYGSEWDKLPPAMDDKVKLDKINTPEPADKASYSQGFYTNPGKAGLTINDRASKLSSTKQQFGRKKKLNIEGVAGSMLPPALSIQPLNV